MDPPRQVTGRKSRTASLLTSGASDTGNTSTRRRAVPCAPGTSHRYIERAGRPLPRLSRV